MANTRFVRPTDNRTLAATALLKNGPSGPALVQDPAYPMANLLTHDRYTVWATGAAAASIAVHIDMGVTASPRMFGLLGLRVATGGYSPSQCAIGYRTSVQGYSSDPGAYTSIGLIILPGLDATLEVGPTAMRYLQFYFGMPGTGWGTGFSLGKLLATSTLQDLGFLYSPGFDHTIVTPQIRTRTQAGLPMVTRIGTPYSRFVMPLRSVDGGTLGVIQNIAGATDPFLYYDRINQPYECLPSRMEWSRSHRWSPPDAWDIDFEFEQLP